MHLKTRLGGSYLLCLPFPNNAAALPADLKYSNRFSVLSQFRSNEQLTANNIADSLNLSRQTVMKNIQFFLKHGLLVSVGKAPSTNIGGNASRVVFSYR